MSGLFSINEIKPFKDDARCRTCQTFNILQHASDVWRLEGEEFVHVDLPDLTGCPFVSKICAGIPIDDDDYKTFDACEKFTTYVDLNGVSRGFIGFIDYAIKYITILNGKRLNKTDIFKLTEDTNRLVVKILKEGKKEENENVNDILKKQFLFEYLNFDLLEHIRRAIDDT